MPVVGLFLDLEAMEVPKNFKDFRKLGVRNIAQYRAANVPFPPTCTSYTSWLSQAKLPNYQLFATSHNLVRAEEVKI